MTDIEFKKKKLANLSAGNEQSYAELQQKTGGGLVLDATGARLEMLMEHLVEWGVVTEEQGLDFELNFHGQIESTLNQAWAQVREQEKASALIVPKKPNNIVDMNGRPLKS